MLSALGKINLLLFRVAAVLVIVMALLGFAIVLLRYGFSWGSIAMQEGMIYLHAYILLMAAAQTLADDGHVRVDIFYSRWAPQRQALINVLGLLLFLLPFAGFLLWSCWDYVADAWARSERSAEPGGLAWLYMLKSLMLLFAAQLLLQTGLQLAANVQRMREPQA